MKGMRTLSAVLLMAWPAAALSSTTFKQNQDTNWHNPNNWTDGVPNIDKDASIDTDKTCIISTSDGAARTLEIKSGATLRIESKNLTIAASANYAVKVDGRIEFKRTSEIVPAVLYHNTLGSDYGLAFYTEGAGVIDGRAANGLGPGEIKPVPGHPGYVMFLRDSATPVQVLGSVRVMPNGDLYTTPPGAFSSGVDFIVDDSSDTMDIGLVNESNPSVAGTIRGARPVTLKTTAGTLRIGNLKFDSNWVGSVIVDGGTFHVTASVPANTHTQAVDFQLNSGTAKFDTQWVNTGDGNFLFTGGTLRVKSGVKATFE